MYRLGMGRVILSFVVVGFLVGCPNGEIPSKKSSVPPPDPVGFLRLADVSKPADIYDMPRDELAPKINDESEFYAESPDDNDEDDCFSKLILDAVKMQAKGTTMFVDAQLDLASCIAKGEGAEEGLISFKTHLYWWVKCLTTNLEKLNGRSIGDLNIEAQDLCKNGGFFEATNMQIDASGEYQDDDGTTRTWASTVLQTYLDQAGRPCKQTLAKGIYSKSGCQITTKETIDSKYSNGKVEKHVEYTQLTGNNLKSNEKERYYNSGSMKFEINRWQGTMTYSSPNSAPSWNATKGAKSASGVYSPPSRNLGLLSRKINSNFGVGKLRFPSP
jgi:hypothetical protein